MQFEKLIEVDIVSTDKDISKIHEKSSQDRPNYIVTLLIISLTKINWFSLLY